MLCETAGTNIRGGEAIVQAATQTGLGCCMLPLITTSAAMLRVLKRYLNRQPGTIYHAKANWIRRSIPGMGSWFTSRWPALGRMTSI